jgi:hypothetical protein
MRKRDHIGDIACTVFMFAMFTAIGLSYATTPHDNINRAEQQRRILDTANRR